MEQQTKNCPLCGKNGNLRRMAKATVALLLACAPSIDVCADNQDIQIRYDKNSYLKNLVITPEIDADLKANKETLLYVVKRKERNYQKISSDSAATVMARIEAIENDMRNIERLKDLKGKKYSNDTDREFANRQIELYKITSDYLPKYAQKELSKNKIGEKTTAILSIRLVTLKDKNDLYIQSKEALENWQQHGPANLRNLLWFDPEAVDEYFVCSDTIVNPYHPTVVWEKTKSRFMQNPQDFARQVNSTYDKEWAWVLKEKGTYTHEDFPHRMDYYRYESHPDLRIIDGVRDQKGVYDKNGNLVAVANPDLGLTVNADRYEKGEMGPLVARFAYENNDHDIQSYDAHTLHYVRNQLGLEELTAKEKAASKAVADGMARATTNYMRDNARYGSKTKKGRQAQEKNAVDFLGAMLSAGSSGYYSSTGSNWFDQIKRDYANIYVIERERIDGVTFRSVYADKDANPLFEITVRYEVDKNSILAYQLKKTFQLKKCSKTDNAE